MHITFSITCDIFYIFSYYNIVSWFRLLHNKFLTYFKKLIKKIIKVLLKFILKLKKILHKK